MSQRLKILPNLWFWLLSCVVLLGVCFRLAHLGDKVFWVDEVATTIRIAGYTRPGIIAALTDAPPLTVSELQKYLQLTSDRSWGDTWNALLQSPEHAPLYFLFVRGWASIFGSSILALRSLSVIFSLTALPCIGWLGWELFESKKTGWIAIALLSLSPFYITYAQEARPYSLWVVLLLISAVSLLRARNGDRLKDWALYTVVTILSIYVSLLSILVVFGQIFYILLVEQWRFTRIVRNAVGAVAMALLCCLPWLWVIAQHWSTLQGNTTWMQSPLNLVTMAIIWVYTLVIPFVDLPVSASLPLLIFIRGIVVMVGLVLLAIAALYFTYKKTPASTWLFIFTFAGSIPLILIAFDLIFAQRISTAPRYWVPTQLGILVAIAHLLSQRLEYPKKLFSKRWIAPWNLVLVALITMGILSGIANWNTSPKYHKTRNVANGAIAQRINQAQTLSPMKVLAEPDEVMDLLSLTQYLLPTVPIQLVSSDRFDQAISTCVTQFIFNPSPELLVRLQQNPFYQLRQVYRPELLAPGQIHLSLWQVVCRAAGVG